MSHFVNCRAFKTVLHLAVFSSLFLFMANLSHAEVKVRGGDSLTTTGFSGIINVASATTIQNGLALSLLTSTDFDNVSLMPRFGFGFLGVLEIAGGVDIPLTKSSYTGGTVGVKWKFWETEKKNVQLALSGNMQFNGRPKDLDMAGQILFHVSWFLNENLETSATFGKTLSSNTTWANWDFGMGAQWWIVSQEIFQLAVAVDFVNYDSRNSMPYVTTKGALYRGNVSAAARFGFLNKTIMFDIGATNIVDSDIALFASVGTSLTF